MKTNLDKTGLTYLWSKITSLAAKYLPLSGGTMTGDLSVNGKASISTYGYVTGTWLKTTSIGDLNSTPTKYAVLDSGGWVYYRTPAELKADLGIPWYGTCDTAAATQAKVVTCDGFTLTTGATITVKFTNGQTYNGEPTMNVNSTGALAVKRASTPSAGIRYQWSSGEQVTFVYDGTYWVEVNGATATTTYYGVTKLSDSVASTSSSLAATCKAVNTAVSNCKSYTDTALETAKTYTDEAIGTAISSSY